MIDLNSHHQGRKVVKKTRRNTNAKNIKSTTDILEIKEAAALLRTRPAIIWRHLAAGNIHAVMLAKITNNADKSHVCTDYALLSAEGVRTVLSHDGEFDQLIDWQCYGGLCTATARADKGLIRIISMSIDWLRRDSNTPFGSRKDTKSNHANWLATYEAEFARRPHGAFKRAAELHEIEYSTFRKGCLKAQELRQVQQREGPTSSQMPQKSPSGWLFGTNTRP